MQRQRGGLVHIGEAIGNLSPAKAFHEATPQARNHFTVADDPLGAFVRSRAGNPARGKRPAGAKGVHRYRRLRRGHHATAHPATVVWSGPDGRSRRSEYTFSICTTCLSILRLSLSRLD